MIPYARNARTHSDQQVAQIAASIREFGFTNPVLIDEADGIIAGHGRVLAARLLGLDEVPCIVLAHLTPAQRRAYVVADNKLELNAGWAPATAGCSPRVCSASTRCRASSWRTSRRRSAAPMWSPTTSWRSTPAGRRPRPGARRAFARPRRGAVHRPGAPHAGAAPRLCGRRQQAGAQRRLGAGHARVRAPHLLRLDGGPCTVLTHLSPTQRRAYVIADNKLALNAGWDLEMLSLEIGEIGEAGFDLNLTGFDEFELGELFAERTQGRTDPDDAPEPPAHPVSEPSDLWVLGRHRLLGGDSTVATDVERVLGGVAPHLMVTDPPYGVNYDPAWRNQAGRSINSTRRVAAGTGVTPTGG